VGRVGFGPGVYVVWRGGRGCGRGGDWDVRVDCGFYDCEVGGMDSRLIVCVGGVIDSVLVKGIIFLSRRNPPSFYLHPHIVPEHPQPIFISANCPQ
jgi:hypothetical protein